MKINISLIYVSALATLLIAGGYANVNADSKQDNFNNNSHNTITSNNNSTDIISFPDASKNSEQVGEYIIFSNKLNKIKSDLKDTKKQLADAKNNKAKNKAIKRINKINNNLAKLNGNKVSILNYSKQSIKTAEKKVKEAKTNEENISARVGLNRAEIGYTQLSKDLK